MIRSRGSIKQPLVSAIAAVVILLVAAACGDEGVAQDGPTNPPLAAEASIAAPALSEMARAGEELFNANCSVCHGANAAGTNQGPTLIDRIYHPGHHSDFSFRNAVGRGVPQHHWTFGNMLPVATVSADDVEEIICYVRELQRANGIFEGDAFNTVC